MPAQKRNVPKCQVPKCRHKRNVPKSRHRTSAGNDNAAGRERKAKTPLSEQGDVKEEGIDLLDMPDD